MKSFETFEGTISNGKGGRSSATKEGKEEIGKLTSLYQGSTVQDGTDRSVRGSLQCILPRDPDHGIQIKLLN